MTTNTEVRDSARKIGAVLSELGDARAEALDAASAVAMGADHETVRVQTARLRAVLERMDILTERAQVALDLLEGDAGLIDEDGRRVDEAVR
jgi:hypothetical protein